MEPTGQSASQTTEVWTIDAILRATQGYFERQGLPSARLDAEVLLAYALGCNRVRLYTHFDQPLTDPERDTYRALVKRRAAREPVAYICGRREFYGRDFAVAPGVLIPRPETEHVVEAALQWAKEQAPAPDMVPVSDVEISIDASCEPGEGSPLNATTQVPTEPPAESAQNPAVQAQPEGSADGVSPAPEDLVPRFSKLRILDVGCGSGALAVTLAAELPGAAIVAADIAAAPLAATRDNAARLGVAAQVECVESDLLSAVEGDFDIIVSNPPYIGEHERPSLAADVVRYEPELALFAGEDGLRIIARLAREVPARLRKPGIFLCEIGYTQADAVVRMLEATGAWQSVTVMPDLQGHPRVVVARC